MKRLRKLTSIWSYSMCLLFATAMIFGCSQASKADVAHMDQTNNTQSRKIQLALLLDTSNSMDGLIDQAKSQLWNVVNEMSAASKDGAKPDLEIALYEYGNDGLSLTSGYIRQVTAFTHDLDLLSEKLFGLKTWGGSEYCGQVIQVAAKELAWAVSNDDLKVIFIAGNEPFTQGPVNYRSACGLAKDKGIVVNTIHCGSYDEGIRGQWKDGADITGGQYMNIDHDKKTVYIKTPYDPQIIILNQRINDTYIYYGASGSQKKEQQIKQDENAASYGAANSVNRTISKSKHVYKNNEWDLVDAAKEDEKVLEKVDKSTLPAEMRNLNTEEQKAFIKQKEAEREKIKSEIATLERERATYIKEKQKETSSNGGAMLENVMIDAVKQQAKAKNYSFEK